MMFLVFCVCVLVLWIYCAGSSVEKAIAYFRTSKKKQ